MREMSEVEAAARTLGLEVATLEIRRAEDIAPAFEAHKNRVEALYVCGDALTSVNRNRIYNSLKAIDGVRQDLQESFRLTRHLPARSCPNHPRCRRSFP